MAILTIPRSQSLRWINANEKNDPQTYDNRFEDELVYAHTLPYSFCHKILQSDGLWFQFRTDYTNIKAYIIDEDNNQILLTKSLVYTDSSDRMYYNVIIDISSIVGNYYLLLSGSDIDKPIVNIYTETFEIVEEFENSILIEWFGNDSYNDQIYWTDLKQSVRLEGYDRDFIPEQSKSVYDNSDYAPITLKSKPIRQTELVINRVPFWLIERVNLGLSHDEFYVQEVQYNTGDVIESEKLTDSRLYKGKIALTQLNYEDGEDQEIAGNIEQSYLMINDTDYLLINDAGDRLKINN